ncbi:hypothetical protein RRG08_047705 [Elysia crispata]|uniref:Uncharacterized protein n=1 Tax=Elysia crispata TaxID=231223 RepID=A0AAE1E6U8_9GAST|nr:hypothetical protein RRG08_047705 [Elysia crispata]
MIVRKLIRPALAVVPGLFSGTFRNGRKQPTEERGRGPSGETHKCRTVLEILLVVVMCELVPSIDTALGELTVITPAEYRYSTWRAYSDNTSRV